MKVTPAMVGRQVKYAARSAKDIAKVPSRGHAVGPMLRSLSKNTMDLRVPWLPFDLIRELSCNLEPGAKVFEYGGGGSSLWLLDRGAEVITVEHDDSWGDRLAQAAPRDASFNLLRRPLGPEYVNAIGSYPDSFFDLVIVDGRERVACVRSAISKVRPGGMLVLDDVDRVRYSPAFEIVPWPVHTFIGFAPCKPTLAYSALFKRPATSQQSAH